MMNNCLPMYEAMSHISASMVEAARANDWDRLVELEQEVSRLCTRLRFEDSPGKADLLDEAGRARKLELIQRILADDLEVRRHAEPWMNDVRTLLGGNARQRAVDRIYRVGF